MTCDQYFPQSIYQTHLKTIGSKEFTQREVDIISCIVNGKDSPAQISELLYNITDPSKAFQHLSGHGIITQVKSIKLKCTGSETGAIGNIKTFIEKLPDFKVISNHLHNHYKSLIIYDEFIQDIKKLSVPINSIANKTKITIVSYAEDTKENKDIIKKYLLPHITNLGIEVSFDTKHFISLQDLHPLSGENNIVMHILPTDHTSNKALSVESQDKKQVTQEVAIDNRDSSYTTLLLCPDQDHYSSMLYSASKTFEYIDKQNYYFAFFKLLQKILPTLQSNIELALSKFTKEYERVGGGVTSTTTPNILNGSEARTTKYTSYLIKYKHFVFYVCISLVSLLCIFNVETTKLIQSLQLNFLSSPCTTWNLPLAVEHYAERPEITKTIWEQFDYTYNTRKTIALVGLHGLGGIGKTTLATHIIHNTQHKYTFKAWFSAETPELLSQDYCELGEKYHLFTSDISTKHKISIVREWLSNQEQALLIYDNAPDIDVLEEFLPEKGHILITSRNYKLPNALEVDIMTEQEAIKLLDNLMPKAIKYNKNYNEDLKSLAKILGYIPLALSQAGAYIANNAITIADYLSLYATDKDMLLTDKNMPPMDHHEPVYVTWDMSISKLKALPEGKQVIELLDIISCCYPEHIPKKLLAQYLYGKTDNESIIKLSALLSLLKQYSLIKTSAGDVSVHRLVQRWAWQTMSLEEQQKRISRVIYCIKTLHEHQYIANNGAIAAALLPHVEHLLAVTVDIYEVQDINAAKLQWQLYKILSNLHRYLGDFTLARKFLLKCHSHLNDGKATTSITMEALEILKLLTDYSLNLGEWQETASYGVQCLDASQKLPNTELIQADCLNNLGTLYKYNNNSQKADEYYKNAILVLKRIQNPQASIIRAEAYTKLVHQSDLLRDRSKEQEMLVYANKLFTELQSNKLYHLDHTLPNIQIAQPLAKYRLELAMKFCLLGKTTEARAQAIEAKYILENCNIHDKLLKSQILLFLGEIELQDDHWTLAFNYLDDSENMRKTLNHDYTFTQKMHKAEIYIRQNEYNKALNEGMEALRVFTPKLYNMLDYSKCLYHIAVIKVNQKDYESSEEYFNKFYVSILKFIREIFCAQDMILTKANDVFARISACKTLESKCTHRDHLQMSADLYSLVYSNNHPFMKNYVFKNIPKP